MRNHPEPHGQIGNNWANSELNFSADFLWWSWPLWLRFALWPYQPISFSVDAKALAASRNGKELALWSCLQFLWTWTAIIINSICFKCYSAVVLQIISAQMVFTSQLFSQDFPLSFWLQIAWLTIKLGNSLIDFSDKAKVRKTSHLALILLGRKVLPLS